MRKQLIFLFILISILFTSCGDSFYEKGKLFYEKEDYENAVTNLKAVNEDDDDYAEARKLILKIESETRERIIKDSLQIIEKNILAKKEKARLDSLKIIQEKIDEENEIDRLKNEIVSIKTFDGSELRGSISSLEIEVAGFAVWGRMAKKAKNSNNKTLKRLGKSMEYHLKRLQIKEFPKIRSEYGRIAKNKLWDEDIDVRVYGSRKTTLQFTGAIFASNRNKKDYQNTLSEILHNFRFKRVNYKWYKYDDEYTYYNLSSDKDDKIVLY